MSNGYDFNPWKGLEEEVAIDQDHSTISNEASLYETFPYIQDVEGVGIGVGMDQMLDIFANTNLSQIYIIDVLPKVSLTTRALLEIGRYHYLRYRSYPSVREFLGYLTRDKITETLELIKSSFSDTQMRIIKGAFSEEIESDEEIRPLKILYYLTFKSKQTYFRSWISDDSVLERVIEAYRYGRIVPIIGSLSGDVTMFKISERISAEGLNVGLIYESNFKMYLEPEGQSKYSQNLRQLPMDKDAKIIKTIMSRENHPLPVNQDQQMKKLMANWLYIVRSNKDMKKEESDPITIEIDGEEFVLRDIYDRIDAFMFGGVSEEIVGLKRVGNIVLAGV